VNACEKHESLSRLTKLFVLVLGLRDGIRRWLCFMLYDIITAAEAFHTKEIVPVGVHSDAIISP
jgi:hypothetical protein